MIGMKHITFLIVAHTLLWGAAGSNLVDSQGGASNPNKQFVDQFLAGDFSESVQIGQDSGVIDSTVGLAVKAVDGIGYIAGILFSPLKLAVNTDLPLVLSVLFQGIFAFWEGAIILSFVRGKNL